MLEVCGYEFQIRERGPHTQPNRWVQLQGNGGQYGSGWLHIKHPDVDRATRSLLGYARRELQDAGGVLREYVEHDDPALRIRPIEVLHVLKCRPIYVEGGS